MTAAATNAITNELIDEISQQLANNQAVRRKLHKHGRVHIDRQLPFLCLYRHPVVRNDQGTEALQLGQAAYLETTADPALHDKVSELVSHIVKTQSTAFGGFLLIELWTSEGHEETEQQAKPGFHLHAPRQNVPNKVLDSFENALLKTSLRQQAASVKVSFDDDCSPPGLAPLLSAEQAQQLKCVILGLEIKPVFRDPTTAEVLPFAMRVMRHALTRALKKVCYSFSHHNTHYKPAHYHELGRHTMTRAVRDVDQQLAEISENFDLLLHVTPVNAHEAWLAFEQGNYAQSPEFHYRPRSADPALLKRQLYQAPLEKIEDPTLADFFASKREELDRQITLLNDRDTGQFLHGSIQLFGQIDQPLLDAARLILAQSGSKQTAAGELLNAEQFAEKARAEIAWYQQADTTMAAKVEVRDDITGILVSHGNFLIGSDAHVSTARLAATLNHEIGTHALTYHNGKKQALQQLYAGMAGYEELQEGLAVLSEYLCGGLTLNRLQLLAGRVIAVNSIIAGADFIETFNTLHQQYRFKPFTAYTISMRVYRGGGYTKDLVYLRGLIDVINYLQTDQELEILYSGKISLEHLPLLHELRWREVLKPIAITPRYLSDNEAQQRLSALKLEPNLNHIMRNL